MGNASVREVRIFVDEARRRCDEHGLKVVFDAKAETASTCKDAIIFPVFRTPMTREQFVKLRMMCIHEVGHRLRPGTFEVLAKYGPTLPRLCFQLWNIVEDEVMEDECRRRWRGDAKALREGRIIHVLDQVKDWRKYGPAKDEETAKMVAAYGMAMLSRLSWQPEIPNAIEPMLDAAGLLARKWYETLVSEGWHDRIVPMSVEDTLALARELYAHLFPGTSGKPKQPEQEQEQGKGKKGDEEQGEQGGRGEPCDQGDSGEQGEPGSERSNSEGKESEENQEGSGSEQGEAQQNGEAEGETQAESETKKTIPWEKLLDDHSKKDNSERWASNAVMEVDYTGWRPGAGRAAFYDKRDIEWGTPWIGGNQYPRHRPSVDFEPVGRGVANRLRRHVQSEMRTKTRKNRLTGSRINKRALKRMFTGSSDYNRAIFTTREDEVKLNTAIVISVDWSTSMRSENKAHIAVNSAAALVDMLEGVLRVPVAVVAHAYAAMGGGVPGHYLLKGFGERIKGEEVVERAKKCNMGGTDEADCLLSCADMLATRKERRKVIIALSDGQPVHGPSGGFAAENLVEAIKYVRESGIELYGVGVGYDGVEQFYGGNCKVIADVATMPNTLIEIAETFVRPT